MEAPLDNDASINGTTTDKLSLEDQHDIALAYQYRLSLKSKPRQSSFRVLALLFYEVESDSDRKKSNTMPPWVAQTTNDGRTFVVGTNDEGGFIGGAICAERAAFVQFRFLPNFKISKVVISTDSTDPITPGLLCREFLAGHPTVPWDVPVITAGCECICCSKRDTDLLMNNDAENGEGFSMTCNQKSTFHSIPTVETTIRDLYPFPSPYTRLTALESVNLGEKYSSRAGQYFEALEEVDSKRLLELAILEARSNVSELHPIQFGAAAIFDDGTIVTTRQASALEYGCTLDAVSQLAPHFQEQDATPLLLVQADQFGIAHSPFAPARAFLIEHGFENCQIVVHDVATTTNENDIYDIDKWTLKEVFVSDLSPRLPTWTHGTTKES